MSYPGYKRGAETCQNGIGEEVGGAESQPKVVDALSRSNKMQITVNFWKKAMVRPEGVEPTTH